MIEWRIKLINDFQTTENKLLEYSDTCMFIDGKAIKLDLY